MEKIVDDEQFPLSDAGSSEITPLSSNSKDIARRLLRSYLMSLSKERVAGFETETRA